MNKYHINVLFNYKNSIFLFWLKFILSVVTRNIYKPGNVAHVTAVTYSDNVYSCFEIPALKDD